MPTADPPPSRQEAPASIGGEKIYMSFVRGGKLLHKSKYIGRTTMAWIRWSRFTERRKTPQLLLPPLLLFRPTNSFNI